MNETAWHWYLRPGDAVEHLDGRRATFQQRFAAGTIAVRTEGNTAEVWDVGLIAPVDPQIVDSDRAGYAERTQKQWDE
jgi:hypothetical protein